MITVPTLSSLLLSFPRLASLSPVCVPTLPIPSSVTRWRPTATSGGDVADHPLDCTHLGLPQLRILSSSSPLAASCSSSSHCRLSVVPPSCSPYPRVPPKRKEGFRGTRRAGSSGLTREGRKVPGAPHFCSSLPPVEEKGEIAGVDCKARRFHFASKGASAVSSSTNALLCSLQHAKGSRSPVPRRCVHLFCRCFPHSEN